MEKTKYFGPRGGDGTEVWRPIPSLPYHEASDAGDIKGVRGGILKFSLDRNGYKVVHPYKSGGVINRKVSKLVAEAFFGPSDLDVHHRNGNKRDDRPENLEYVPHGSHQILGGGVPHRGNPKLNEEDVRAIKRSLKNRPDVSQRKLARSYGVSFSCISDIAHKHTWAWLEI